MTDASTLQISLNGAVDSAFAERDPLEQMSQIRWKKPLRKKAAALLKTAAHAELAELLIDQWSTGPINWKSRKSSAWRVSVDSLLATLSGSVDTERFESPVWETALQPSCELLTAALHLSLRAKNKQRKTQTAELADFTQQLRQFLAENEPVGTSANSISDRLWLDLRITSLGYILLLTGSKLPPMVFLELWLRLYRWAEQLLADSELPWNTADEADPLFPFRAEVSCLLAVLFDSTVAGFKPLYNAGCAEFAAQLDAATDTDGTPQARFLTQMQPWFSCFTRHQQLVGQANRKFLSAKSQVRWSKLLERLCSLTAGSGELVFHPTAEQTGSLSQQWTSLLAEALTQLESLKPAAAKAQISVQRLRQSLKHSTKRQADQSLAAQPNRAAASDDMQAATQSDWAQLACLRNNWYPGADLLAVQHTRPQLPVHLATLSVPLLQGLWETELTVAGKPVLFDEAWSSMCWYNVENCDYLELRIEAPGVTLDRQLFLSRNDHLAILADAISLTDATANFELSWRLPLSPGWTAAERPGQRDRLLKQRGNQVRVLPLAIPADAVQKPDGRLEVDDQTLLLKQRGQQRGCMPLLLDWSPLRRAKAVDWSRLTVTENREILGSSIAFAARARVGRHQWLFLRNLEHSGIPRAVLGMHTDAETVIGDFLNSGQTEKLVEVHYAS